MTVSAIVHLSLVAFLMYTEMRPLHPMTEDTIPVEVVVDEKKPDTQPFPQPSPELPKSETPALPSANPSAAPSSASQPASPATRATRRETLPQSPPQPQPQSQPQPQPQSQAAAPTPSTPAPAPGYTAPEPDLTIKYHVMLGLPGDVPVASSFSAGGKRGEDGDTDPASDKLGSPLIEALRRHLKSCSKLPAALSPSDNVAVKLRVQLAPNGRLAAEPALIEGTASMKGVQLMQGAIAALSACQPYAMLPAERYGEWKVLDLSFTPHDFNS
jgi:outer membrane biosynthesis protein TonB